MSQERVRQYFDGLAANYDQTMRGLEWATLGVFAETLADFPGRYNRVLDLCAGTGLSLGVIKEQISPEHTVAVDFSSEMLAELTAKYGHDTSVGTVCMPVERYVELAEPEHFDLVSMVAGVHFLSDEKLARVTRGIARILRPEGLFMGTVDIVIDGHPFQSQREMQVHSRNPKGTHTIYKRHPDEVINVLAASELQLERLRFHRPRPGEEFEGSFWVARKSAKH